jgi:hypothetical protein
VLFLLLFCVSGFRPPGPLQFVEEEIGRVTRHALTMRKKKQAFGLQGLHINYSKQFNNDQTVGVA